MSRKTASNKTPRSLPEEALERAIQAIDGPVNRRVERFMKSRVLLAPAGLLLTLGARSLIALRDLDPWALVRSRRDGKDGAG